MADIIKMDYGLMDDMSRTFTSSVEVLQDVLSEMQKIANEMENGALRGRGGDAFTDALRTKLSPAIGRLVEKYEELAQDLQAAKRDMQQADAASKRELSD